MQKVNVLSLVLNHFSTLRSERGRFLWSDAATFLGFPLIVGVLSNYFEWRLSLDAIGLSVSVFSIFAALLLSVQVALYSISLRPLDPPSDPKMRRASESRQKQRSEVLRQLSDNIAYLILLSVVFVSSLLVVFAVSSRGVLITAVIAGSYTHFVLTLLMVVKRASIVFSREHER